MRKDHVATAKDAFEKLANPYVDEDDYNIECGELDDTEFLAAGRDLHHSEEDY